MEHPWGQASLANLVDLLVMLVEAAGAVVIFVGAAIAFTQFVGAAIRGRHTAGFVPIRLGLGRFLTLGLEFQLAGDILRTAVAPTLREIAELAAIATIRTALNYFLNKEIQEARTELRGLSEMTAPGPGGTARGTP
ncbi:DUF1622 domain-containing protein [Catellatospora sichuanensis]|uniref:DUF1622 domain-containing protein n=1 Tax=Catellatospora sichuanensis TaxID=1969805 RepID=UPI001181F916|nr:DUF1622 domain-containing protein [Catellatospora sichuanensis]